MPDNSAVSLHYENSGRGRPLIILHGLFGSLANWRPLSQQFSEHYQVFLVDQRNHGRSPHSDTFSYAAMAEDVRAFIQHHRLTAPYLLGHSMGGKTAMQLATTYPDEVEKLVIVDMSPRASRPRHEHIIAALQSLNLKTASSRRELSTQLAQYLPDAALRQFLLMNVTTNGAGHLCWRINLDAIAAHYDEINKAIGPQQVYSKPALFIRGENSDYIGDEDVEAIKILFPRAEIATIAGAGHWVHADAPEAFAERVLQFFAG